MACRISSLTRDQTLAPCGGSMDSPPPGHQQSSHAFVLHLLLWLFATPWAVAWQALLTWDFPGKNPRMGCHFLLQGIFSNPELEPMSPVSSALQVDSLPLSHNFTFIISLYGGDLKLHFYKHFIEESFCRMLTEINFLFSVAFFTNTYLGLTLSSPRVTVHPSLRSDCPSQWPSWAKPFKSAPGWHHLSGPWVASAPLPLPQGHDSCWELSPLCPCHLWPAHTSQRVCVSQTSEDMENWLLAFLEVLQWWRQMSAGGGGKYATPWPRSLNSPQDHTSLERLWVDIWCW